MRSWKRRIATAWKVLTGKQCLLTDAATRFVYVQHPGRDGQIVQLATYQDRILALDNNGDVWSRFVGEDGKVFGKKKRMYHKCSPHARIFLLQLDRMKCPLRMSIDSLELRLRKP
jgi:alpha-tubulin suppressor-like RCC1 family protein